MTESDDIADERERQLLRLLKDYPVARADSGFYDRALARAVHTGTRSERLRWIMAGFGSAVAAGIVLLVVNGWFFAQPNVPAPDDGALPGISIALMEPSTVRLMFAAREPLDNATLSVRLPHGIELAGFPGQQEVSWVTSLAAGRNVLPLELIATSSAGGEVVARLEHKDRNRTFRLRVNIG